MDQREYGDHAALHDAEWRSRVQESARADVKAMLRATRRRRVERWLVASMVLVAIVAVLMLLAGVGVFDRVFAESKGGTAVGESGNAESVLPAVDANRPFARTPAADWADGEAGIQAPPPMRVGEFSAEEVATTTARVREALIASRLDPALLTGHDPNRYLGLLAKDAAGQLAPLFGTGREPQAQALVSLIDGDSKLLPATPKVSGSMKVEAGGPGELVVRTNYLFAYAFAGDPDSPPKDPMKIVVLVRADVEYILRQGSRWTAGSQGLWYGDDVDGFGYSIACDAYKRGYLAPAYRDRGATHVPPKQDRTAYFDATAAIPAESGCPA
ncbi:hypothetical protein [Actinokineospora sp. NBRC 105648]|uniref:hypothetical protein n=1 Tax=Actinokineospora sp. NBRC 105648 TaxID=3032206 RepID=UPI0024A5ABA7|nr:hypothetical protein [Actinokineospora sp. NBRC 105648]GLZ37721.1 hypothetical protein Acsp05_13460 [Actinokineospora sp. NBRC 105648]